VESIFAANVYGFVGKRIYSRANAEGTVTVIHGDTRDHRAINSFAIHQRFGKFNSPEYNMTIIKYNPKVTVGKIDTSEYLLEIHGSGTKRYASNVMALD
jgi:hypothetical protein